MAKVKINSAYNIQDIPKPEITPENVGVSETVPNEVMTIKQLVKRAYAGNMPEEIPSSYFDTEIENINSFYRKQLDLVELQDLQRSNKALRDRINNTFEELKNSDPELDQNAISEQSPGQADDAGGSEPIANE